jgi:predicted S18 family serine protease
MRTRLNWGLGIVLGIGLIVAGCGQKEKQAAQAAISAAQATINSVQEEAQKYVPEQLHDAQTALQHAKDTLQNGDYPAAVSAARDALNKAKAVATQTIGQQEQWTSLNHWVTKSLEDAKAKIDAYTSGTKMPKGMNKSKLNEAKKEYEQLKQKWTETWEGSRGDAAQKGAEIKEEVEKLKEKLGIK